VAEDSIKPTPETVPVAGSLSRLIDRISGWMENTGSGGAGEPSLRAVPEMLGMRGAARQLSDVAYGQSHVLDDTARGRSAREDVVNSIPLAATAGSSAWKAAGRVSKALPKLGGAQLNMFVGPQSKTADLEALARAQKAETAGKTPEEIWQNTMWMRGPDGKWRSEISDSESKLNSTHEFKKARGPQQNKAEAIDDALALQSFAEYHGTPEEPGHHVAIEAFKQKTGRDPHPLAVPYAQNHTEEELYKKGAALKNEVMSPITFRMDDVHQHPELYAAYPEARAIPYNMQSGGAARGSYGADRQGDTMGEVNSQGSAASPDPRERSVALHELQHSIQEREGFDGGANPTHIQNMKAVPTKVALSNLDDAENARTLRKMMDSGQSFDEAFNSMGHDEVHAGSAENFNRPGMREWYKSTTADFSSDNLRRNESRKVEDFVKERENFPPLTASEAREAYFKNMGETEARTTEARKDLTLEERRNRFPMKDYDRPAGSLYSEGNLYAPRTRLNPENLKRPGDGLAQTGEARFINKIVGP
jgi:hypothetical protein